MKKTIITSTQQELPIDPKKIPTAEQLAQSIEICKKTDLIRLDKDCLGFSPGIFCIICGMSGKGK